MASQGGRGKRGVSLQVQQWVAEGHGAADIASLLKVQGYKKSRVSQLLRDLKREDKQAAGPASVNILCQRCGFPNCSCAVTMEGQRKRQKIPQEAAGAEPAGELQMASEAAAEDL